MSSFSPSDAALEGFDVIRRQWRVIAGWSMFNLLVLVGGCVLLVLLLFCITPFLGSPETAGRLGGVLGAVLLGLGGLVVQLMMVTGVYRLMLRPDQPAFLHLRVGKDEFRLLAVFVLAVLAIAVAIVPAMAIYSAANAVSGGLGAVVAVVSAIAIYVLVLRIGPAGVISFAEGRIDLKRAWVLTRGQTLRLVGMALLFLCLVALIEIVGWILLFLITGAVSGFRDMGVTGPESLTAHPGRYILTLALQMLAAPFLLVIGQAPWVAVYTALTGQGEAEEA